MFFILSEFFHSWFGFTLNMVEQIWKIIDCLFLTDQLHLKQFSRYAFKKMDSVDLTKNLKHSFTDCKILHAHVVCFESKQQFLIPFQWHWDVSQKVMLTNEKPIPVLLLANKVRRCGFFSLKKKKKMTPRPKMNWLSPLLSLGTFHWSELASWLHDVLQRLSELRTACGLTEITLRRWSPSSGLMWLSL